MTSLQAAAQMLKSAERVMVIGCSGGGKTTLSMRLSDLLALPYISMDREFFWLPGWQKRDKAEELSLIAHAVSRERWLMDGNGPSSFHLRLPRADLVIWVRMPRMVCVKGALVRAITHLGRTRQEMALGCKERIDFEFLRFIWNFERKSAPVVEQKLAQFGGDVPVFQVKSRDEMKQLLDLVAT